MVRLSRYPYRVIEADEDHPLVKEALRGRKTHEPCWCGSGKKYKKCHRVREQAKPMSLGQILHGQKRIFWRRRGCMHPNASPTTCSGTVIDSHTIQRKGALRKIVDESNHVLRFEPDQTSRSLTVNRIGWKRASTFPGYCSSHDTATFGDLERVEFSGTHEQCVLQAFRNVCNELYKKRALIECLEYQRDVLDRGRSLDEQINVQLSISNNIEGQRKSEVELHALWRTFNAAVVEKDYDSFRSRTYFFNGELSITSSAAMHTEFDFDGKKLMDMWDIGVDAEMLSHSVMATERGGAIAFVWPSEEKTPELLTSSFDRIPNAHKGDIFVQYCFLNCENTFFSPSWWNQLDDSQKSQLKAYAGSLFYEGGAYRANHIPLINWTFI